MFCNAVNKSKLNAEFDKNMIFSKLVIFSKLDGSIVITTSQIIRLVEYSYPEASNNVLTKEPISLTTNDTRMAQTTALFLNSVMSLHWF